MKCRATVHSGDCLRHVSNMSEGSVDLVYVDPPFFTQKKHSLTTRDRTRAFSFSDIWESQSDYGTFLLERLAPLHKVLSDKGSLFFHCDHNATHIGRAILDRLFGENQFRSEIIWHYRRWSNSRKGLLPSHQSILYYTKSDDYTFNQIWTEYSPSTNVDQILQRRTRDNSNKSVYELDDDGDAVPNGMKKGVPLGDVWDIPYLNPKARERVGYPTQKPIALLERIIQMTTDEDDCVLDPFCGSGTTLVASQLMNRRSIGIDVSLEAVDLTRSRLASPIKTESALMQNGRESYRLADERMLSLLEGIDVVPVQRNKGIDALVKDEIDGTPIPILFQRPKETLGEAARKLVAASRSKGAKVMFLVACMSRREPFLWDDIPEGVIVVNTPAIDIREHISRLKAVAKQ
jgi:site-specific DNA-methyltransferase (adenine-specific)